MHGHADGRATPERAQRADDAEEVRLGVRGAAAVDRAVSLDRLERRGRPQRLVTGGDDVVVGVEEHRRRAVGGRHAGDDDRGDLALDHQVVDVVDARAAQQLDDEVVCLEQRLGRLTGPRHRRDRHEPAQLLDELGHRRADRVEDDDRTFGRHPFAVHEHPPWSRRDRVTTVLPGWSCASGKASPPYTGATSETGT